MNKNHIDENTIIGNDGLSFLEIQTKLTEIYNKVSEIKDYVIEKHNRINSWSYIKFKSGMIIAEGIPVVTADIINPEGSLYYCHKIEIRFPEGLFDAAPACTFSCELTGGYGLYCVPSTISKERALVWFFADTKLENCSFYLNIVAIKRII